MTFTQVARFALQPWATRNNAFGVGDRPLIPISRPRVSSPWLDGRRITGRDARATAWRRYRMVTVIFEHGRRR